MARARRNIAICTYRVKCGEEQRFGELLERHWQILSTFGLVTDRAPQVYLGVDESQAHVVVEIFEWLDDGASARAELLPQVLEVWDPMTACCEERLGHPAMEFPHYELLPLGMRTRKPPRKRAGAKRPAPKKAASRKVAPKKAAAKKAPARKSAKKTAKRRR